MLESRYSLPNRRYITETVLPCIVDSVTAEVRKAIVGVQWISFTTDLWSTDVSNDSSALLTAHRSTDSFERKLAVLHAQTFPGTHTSDVICAKYAEMLERWEIKKEQLCNSS